MCRPTEYWRPNSCISVFSVRQTSIVSTQLLLFEVSQKDYFIVKTLRFRLTDKATSCFIYCSQVHYLLFTQTLKHFLSCREQANVQVDAFDVMQAFTVDFTCGVTIGVGRGCTGCKCTPQGREKIWAKFTGESCKYTPGRVHPRGRARVQFLGNWGDLDGGRGYLGSFSVYFESDD